MESFNKASTSQDVSDSSDDNNYDKISIDELSVKLKTFRDLCLRNKINKENAFDIDMIGSFNYWLKKKKPLTNVGDVDVTLFQEISDYLDASSKVYSYRVDNCTETISNLIEQFKNENNNEKTTKMDVDVELKNKKQGLNPMLSTADKLRKNSNVDVSISSLINETSFSLKELFNTGRPHRTLNSSYYNKSLAEELNTSNDEKNENDDSFYLIEDIENELDQQVICPDFNNFIASNDEFDSADDDQLEGIEYHLDPNNHQLQNNFEDLNCDEPDNTELDSNSNYKDKNILDGLMECIDNIDRDYSCFNPQLLAKWNGPKTWKDKAMSKALKSYDPNERKDIDSNSDVSLLKNIEKTNTSKSRNIVKKDKLNINWLSTTKIDELLISSMSSRKQLLPYILQNWDAINSISDSPIIVDIKYKNKLLEHIEKIPDWWKNKNSIKKYSVKHSNSHQNILDCDKTAETHEEATEMYYEDTEMYYEDTEMYYVDTEQLINEDNGAIDYENINDNLCNLNEPEELNHVEDKEIESKMSIRELKKEISDIIDEECVGMDPNSEWSSKISFLNLLNKLRVYERNELSIPIVFVGLLHLANARGLKLFKENCVMNNIEEEIMFIVKPMNKK